MPHPSRAAALACAIALAGTFAAAAATPGRDIFVSSAWSRPTPKGLPTAVVYLTLSNPGATADRLTGGSTPVAERMTLHRTSMAGGVMSMTPVTGGLDIPAHGQAALAPNGYHFMLTGLKRALVAGETFPATLSFARAGKLDIQVVVRASAPGDAMAGMKMK